MTWSLFFLLFFFGYPCWVVHFSFCLRIPKLGSKVNQREDDHSRWSIPGSGSEPRGDGQRDEERNIGLKQSHPVAVSTMGRGM